MMSNRYFILVVLLLMTFILACSQSSPTDAVVEEKPEPYIPDWTPGESIVLSYAWADTSGDGQASYFGSAVTIAGRLDSIWFNFPRRCGVTIDFAILAENSAEGSQNPGITGVNVVYAATINAGKYLYAFAIDQNVESASIYKIQLNSEGTFPLPLMGYLRVEY